MMAKIVYIVFILLGSYSCAGKKETCTTTGVVDKIMWGYTRDDIRKNVYFSFTHDYKIYVFKQEFSDIMKLNVGDSIQVQYYCKNPKQAFFVKIIKHNGAERRDEVKVVTSVGVSKKAYHLVEKKPLFDNVQKYIDNDSAVDLYLKKELKKRAIQEHGKIAISIVIDKTGKIVESVIIGSTNQMLNDLILSIIKDMPTWTPAEHKGQKVNVDFLIELEW